MTNQQHDLLKKENDLLKAKIKELEARISDSEKIYEEWNKLTTRFTFLEAHTPLGFIEWNTDFTIKEWSNSAQKIFGFTFEEVKGKKAKDLILPADIVETLSNWFDDIVNNKTILTAKNKNITKQGREIICEWYNIPVCNSDGVMTGVASFVSDITERIKKEEELEKAKQKAEDSDNLKSYFLANMSHEIRTPMNGILGFAELLKEPNLPELKKLEYVDRINSCGNHLLHLINDIIDISKIEAGKINISERECSLSALYFDLFFFFQSENQRSDKSHIEISMEKEPALGGEDDQVKIITDVTRLRQILTNLIGNAVKFTKHGKVTFGYKFQDKNNILFFVKDTGIGIPKEKLSVIFDRFRQVDSSTTRKYGGTGLGLAISKGLVELLGGQIWVESEEHEGSVFYFTLPYKKFNPTSAKEEIPLSHNDKKYEWTSKTLLIVEDDETSIKYYQELLLKTNARILHARTAKKAIELIKKIHDIDIVLMDIHLQGMNGYEATKKIKELKPSLPIIAQTASAMEDDRKKCIAAGCNDYISKPIDKKSLLEKMNKYLL